MWRKLSSRFFLGLIRVDDERDFILHMQIVRRFNDLGWNIILTFHISKGKNNSLFHRKTQTITYNPLKVCFFFNEEEAAE